MMKTIDEHTEREIEELLEKLIVDKVRESIRAESKNALQALEGLETEIKESVSGASGQLLEVCEEIEEKQDQERKKVDERMDAFSEALSAGFVQSGEQIDTKLDKAQNAVAEIIREAAKENESQSQKVSTQLDLMDASLREYRHTCSTQLESRADRLEGMVGEQRQQFMELNQKLLKRHEKEQVFEAEIFGMVQTTFERVDAHSARLAEERKQENLELVQQLHAQEKKLELMEKLVIALMSLQGVGVLLTAIQLLF